MSSVAETNGNHIKLKASGFPTTAAYGTDGPDTSYEAVNLNNFNAASFTFKRAFDLVIQDAAGKEPEGGLLLVGPGNLNSDQFSVGSLELPLLMQYPDKPLRLEGVRSTPPKVTANQAYEAGWNIFGLFLSPDAPPNAPSAAANAAPFGFTGITTQDGNPINPFMFCRTTISTIKKTVNGNTDSTLADTAKDNTKLTDGQKASCYVGASTSSSKKDTAAFSGLTANDWLTKAEAGDNDFKSKFYIAIKGIITGDKPISKIGLDSEQDQGADTAPADAAADFRDGLGVKDINDLAAANPNSYETFLVSLERGSFTDDQLKLKLKLKPYNTGTSDTSSYVKVKDNVVYISAQGLAGANNPLADPDDTNRTLTNLDIGNKLKETFQISFSDDKAGIFLVTRKHVNKDSIILRASRGNQHCIIRGPEGEGTSETGSETKENTFATTDPGGAICRRYTYPDQNMKFNSYLGTVFAKKTNPDNDARAIMSCSSLIGHEGSLPLSDASKLAEEKRARCLFGIVNNGNVHATKEINDNWVNTGDVTNEVELYAIGIRIDGKKFPELSDATGFKLAKFNEAMSNADFKKLLDKNRWAELTFRVRVVHSDTFNGITPD